jgi:hypothetical protein
MATCGFGRKGNSMLPLYEDPHVTFRCASDRVIPRFRLEGVPAGRHVSVPVILLRFLGVRASFVLGAVFNLLVRGGTAAVVGVPPLSTGSGSHHGNNDRVTATRQTHGMPCKRSFFS